MEFHIETYAQLESTQDELIHLIKSGQGEEGKGVQALSQSSGRGRQGRSWEGPMGNLYLSLALKPDIVPRNAGQIAFVAGMAVYETVRSLLGEDKNIALKWPNDVLVDGCKIAGLLIEKHEDFYILGIGLNILAPPDNAAGLQEMSDKRLPVNPVRDMLLDILSAYITRWEKEGFEVIREQWMRQAAFVNEEIKVRLPQETISGIFKGIDNKGALLLETDNQTQRIWSGDVFLGHQDATI